MNGKNGQSAKCGKLWCGECLGNEMAVYQPIPLPKPSPCSQEAESHCPNTLPPNTQKSLSRLCFRLCFRVCGFLSLGFEIFRG